MNRPIIILLSIGLSAGAIAQEPTKPALDWSIAEDKVRDHAYITGAEDFALFEERIPGLYLMLGINEPGVAATDHPPNHSPYFDSWEGALLTGVRAHVGFALGYADRLAD